MLQFVAAAAAVLFLASCANDDKKTSKPANPAGDDPTRDTAGKDTASTLDSGSTDTASTYESVPPANVVPYTVQGQIMGLFVCRDQSDQEAVCYVSQFPGNYENAPRTELHQLTGDMSSGVAGLTDNKLTDFVYDSDQANVNTPVSIDVDGQVITAIPYNAVSSAVANASDSMESFGGLQSTPFNGVAFYQQGTLISDLSFASLDHGGYPLTGPVAPVVANDHVFVGANNYGNGSESYQGSYGAYYGPSVIVELDESLSSDSAVIHPLVDEAGNPYYELRSVATQGDEGLLLTACNASGQPVLLEYNASNGEVQELSDLSVNGAGFTVNTDEEGNVIWGGDPSGFVELTGSGSIQESNLDGIATSFVAGVSHFGAEDGAHLVSLQEEVNPSTIAASMLWVDSNGTPMTLAQDESAQSTLPHIELAAGAFGLSQRLAVGAFSGSDRTADSSSPWSSTLNFVY